MEKELKLMSSNILKEEYKVNLDELKNIILGYNKRLKFVVVDCYQEQAGYFLTGTFFVKATLEEGTLRKLFSYLDNKTIPKSSWHSKIDRLTTRESERYSTSEFFEKLEQLDDLDIYLYQFDWK